MSSTLPPTMLALHLHPPSTLSLSPTPLPTPSPTQYLIRISATAPTNSELLWPETFARPSPIPCHDLVGTVVSLPTTSSGNQRFRIGDSVHALVAFSRDGCAAEFCVAEPEELSLRPENVSDVQAATIPLSALSAWQALFVHGEMKAGERVLVLGASGGVGVMAVQLAKAKGAVVTATCSAGNADLVRSLGVDEVILHGSGDSRKQLEGDFNLVVDCVGSEARRDVWEKLKNGGLIVSIASPIEEGEIRGGRRGMFFIVEPNGAQLDEIGGLIQAGKLRAVVDSVVELRQGEKAFERLSKGHMKGKVVITVP